MKSKFSILKRLAKFCLKSGLFFVAAMLLVILYLSTIGFPRSALLKLNNAMSQGDYVFEAGKVRIDLLEGLRFKKVSVYRKTVMGPPLLEAAAVLVRFDSFCCDSMRISRIEFIDGVVRPDRIHSSSEEGSKTTGDRILELEARNCTVAGCDIIEGSVLLQMTAGQMILTIIFLIISIFQLKSTYH
jgi:hypothetical protein